MRVYHFLKAKYGIESLENGRLKIATIGELNDPFELLGIDLSDRDLRTAFLGVKRALAQYRGLLCFSRQWRNPLLWSHYADRHQGICLGFDIPDELAIRVNYTRKRLSTDDLLSPDQTFREGAVTKILATKFSHWRYEDEVRRFVSLEEANPRNGLYFYNFSEDLRLMQVIVGAESSISRNDIDKVLGQKNAHVERFKARPAFKTFKVVMNRDKALWC